MIRAERFHMITELADQNGDGIMTLEELAEYLHEPHRAGCQRLYL